MTSRPSEYPDWATADQVDATSGVNNVVSAPTAYQNYGWTRGEKPPRQYWNWFGRFVGQWIRYLEERLTGSRTIPLFTAVHDAGDYDVEPLVSAQNGWCVVATTDLYFPVPCAEGSIISEASVKVYDSGAGGANWSVNLLAIDVNFDASTTAPIAPVTIDSSDPFTVGAAAWKTETLNGGSLPYTVGAEERIVLRVLPHNVGDYIAGATVTFDRWVA